MKSDKHYLRVCMLLILMIGMLPLATSILTSVPQSVDVQSNSPDFNGDFLLATYIATSTSTDSIVARFNDGDEVDDQTITRNVDIRGKVLENIVDYPVDSSRNIVPLGQALVHREKMVSYIFVPAKHPVTGKNYGSFISDAECHDAVSIDIAHNQKAIKDRIGRVYYLMSNGGLGCEWRYLFYVGDLDQVGEIQTGNAKTTTEWFVTRDGANVGSSVRIGSTEDSRGISAWIGNRNVFVEYIGDLGGFFDKPEVGDTAILLDKDDSNQWQLIDSRQYEAYLDVLDERAPPSIENELSGQNDWMVQLRDRVNNKWGAVRNSGPSFDFDVGRNGLLNGISFRDGTMKLEMEPEIRYPAFRLLIDGEFIGLKIETGVPEIVSVENIKGVEGSVATFNVRVRNVGDAEGSFELFVRDCSDSSISVPRRTINLNPGELDFLDMSISGNVPEGKELGGSCELVFKEVKTQVEDTHTFTYNFKNSLSCLDGQERVIKIGNSDAIEVCKDNEWTLKELCDSGERAEIVDNAYQCVALDPDDPVIDDENGINKPALIIALVVGLIVAVGLFLWVNISNIYIRGGIALAGGGVAFVIVGWIIARILDLLKWIF